MLLYRLRGRILQFEGGVRPRFPETAIVEVPLEPEVPFGGAPGISRNTVADSPFKFKLDLLTGRSFVRSETPLFDSVACSVAIADTQFAIRKNVVSVQSLCTSEQDLVDLMSAVFYAFPAVLNLYLPDAPFPTYAKGRLGTAKFNWIFDPKELLTECTVTSKVNQERLITDAWRYVATVAQSRRLVGALYYFHVACRLLAAGQNRFEFMAEALLNFAKSLQSVFGESHNRIRWEIEKLGCYDNSEIEGKFISAMKLRDDFDVAHASLSILSLGELRVLHDYTNIAEDSFRGLFKTVILKVQSGDYALLADSESGLSRKKQRTLRILQENIKPFCQ